MAHAEWEQLSATSSLKNRQKPFMEKFAFGFKYIVVENKYRQGNVLYTFAFSDIEYSDK